MKNLIPIILCLFIFSCNRQSLTTKTSSNNEEFKSHDYQFLIEPNFSGTIDRERDKSVSITNVIQESFKIISVETNFKMLTKMSNDVIIPYKVMFIQTITNEINQLSQVIFESPVEAYLDENIMVYIKIIDNNNHKKYDLQVKTDNNQLKKDTLYINLETLDPESSEILLRYVSDNKGSIKITYIVKFLKTGTRYLNVVIYKGNFSNPIIEQKIKVIVTFKTWLERFWKWLLGAIGALSGATAGILLLIQNSKKIKTEVKKNDGNLNKDEEEILLKKLIETEEKLIEIEKQNKEL